MRIRVLSFDFDGCLADRAYCSLQDKDIIAHNKDFLDKIKEENKSFSNIYIFLGSNRQSKGGDECNSLRKKTGSCFPALKKISEYLEATYDTFLLADLYGNIEAGTAYNRIMQELEDTSYKAGQEHATWVFDKTKATVLYAQMQKIASENPEATIIFDFYDDRCDILQSLKGFYNKHSDLIPPNVTLQLHQYTGRDLPIEKFKDVSIKGTGIIDKNYNQTVKDMVKLARSKSSSWVSASSHAAKGINVAGSNININLLKQGKKLSHRSVCCPFFPSFFNKKSEGLEKKAHSDCQSTGLFQAGKM